MERKLRFSFIGKELKRFWWLGTGMLLLVGLVILIYSTAIYVPKFTVKADEHVYCTGPASSETGPKNEANALELKNVYQRINDQKIKDFLGEEIRKYDPSYNPTYDNQTLGLSQSSYALSFNDNIYSITVTMLKKEDALAVAGAYLDYLREVIGSKIYDINGYKFFSNTVSSPILKSEAGLTPSKMCIFGFGGVLLIYLVFASVAFYFNKRLYGIVEFQDNFDAVILESNVKKRGYRNIVIKLQVQCKQNGLPYILALGGKIDADAFVKCLQSEGFSVLKTTLNDAISLNRELVEDGSVDMLRGDNSLLKAAIDCKEILKKSYRYDFILISAGNNYNVENYITAADISDGTILGFDLKADTYKYICGVFKELDVVKNLNLLGVVL